MSGNAANTPGLDNPFKVNPDLALLPERYNVGLFERDGQRWVALTWDGRVGNNPGRRYQVVMLWEDWRALTANGERIAGEQGWLSAT